MKILITGAAGFSAKPLIQLLESIGGDEIITTDMKEFFRPGHKIVKLTEEGSTTKLIKDVRPDVIYHLAGTFSQNYDIDYSSNVLSARLLLDALISANIKCRVLLIGSAAEYGFVTAQENPVPETHMLRPSSIYGLTKSMQTNLMGYYFRRYDMDLVLARTFNLFGSGISPVLLPGRLELEIDKYRRGESREIRTGPLSGIRDFIHINDATHAYVDIMKKGKSGEVYNVGNGQPIDLRDFVVQQLENDGIPLSALKENPPDSNKAPTFDIWADVTKYKSLV